MIYRIRNKVYMALWGLILMATIAGFHWSTSNLTAVAQTTKENPAEIYSTHIQTDLRSAYIQIIKEAKKSVYISIYSLTDPAIIKALKQKSEEGIPVTVVYDAKASSGVDSKLGTAVKGIARNGKGLMHLKILVVDGTRSLIGSANFTPTSLRSHANLVLGFYSEDLAKLLETKIMSLCAEGKVGAISRRDYQINDQNVEVWFLPDNPNAIARLKQLIQTANKSIKVGMFTWTRYDLAHEMIDAKNRGINVQIIMDRSSGQGVSAVIADLLYMNGVNVRFSQGSALLHHKFMIIDEDTLVNGSANWTKAAFTQNDDCFIVLSRITASQNLTLHNIWKIMLEESDLYHHS